MEIAALTGHIGAEVRKLQLADLNDAKFVDLAQALWVHQVPVSYTHLTLPTIYSV